MKIFVGTILAILVIAGTSCEQVVNVEKEKEAIMALLEKDDAAAIAKDADGMLALHVQDELSTRLEFGEYGYSRYNGWEEISTLLGDYLGGDGGAWGENPVNTKENMVIKVTGNSAWLTYDNKWEWTNDGVKGGYNNIQIVFLEKIKGEWKISFSAIYSKSVL